MLLFIFFVHIFLPYHHCLDLHIALSPVSSLSQLLVHVHIGISPCDAVGGYHLIIHCMNSAPCVSVVIPNYLLSSLQPLVLLHICSVFLVNHLSEEINPDFSSDKHFTVFIFKLIKNSSSELESVSE